MAIPFNTVRERWNADLVYRFAHAEVSPEMNLAFAMAEVRRQTKLSQGKARVRLSIRLGGDERA